eukprot:4151191-Alexandrium_andersonii.AAC.1
MSPISTLEAERARIIDPLTERWLGRPLGHHGRFAGPQAALDPPPASRTSGRGARLSAASSCCAAT